MSKISIWYAKITGDKEGKLAEQDAWNELPMGLKNAPRYIPSELEDWLEVLQDTSNLTPEREATARRIVWRNSNDHNRLRSDGQPWSVEPALCFGEATANRLALLELLENGNPSSPTEKAELLRQLGKFNEAISLVESASHEVQRTPLAVKIVQLAKSGDAIVSEV
ncbi:MAG: hypothetical protein Q7T57_01680 [Dehalococcoidales bacterium]|nr:hypothetical protein [Dehalococcoidales bacterium]